MIEWLQLGTAAQLAYLVAMLREPLWNIVVLVGVVVALRHRASYRGYFYAIFVGTVVSLTGVVLFALGMLALHQYTPHLLLPPGAVSGDVFSLGSMGIMLMLQGAFILQRHTLVFALLTLLSFNPVFWVINASYTLYLLHREKMEDRPERVPLAFP